jgi:RND family efflux transporter MFP subunit
MKMQKNAYENALNQFESAKRNKGIQQTQISYGYIYAPRDGVIASKNIELNENVSPGQVIGVLNAGKQINILVGLPETVINKVQTGMQTDLSFSAIENQQLKGTIIEISPVVNSNSATYPIKVALDKVTPAVKPGMTANVKFDFGDKEKTTENSIIIPAKSVGEDGVGNFVFIIEPDSTNKSGIVKKQHITINLNKLTNNGFKVESGLENGQFIATAGLQTLLDGQKVKLQ